MKGLRTAVLADRTHVRFRVIDSTRKTHVIWIAREHIDPLLLSGNKKQEIARFRMPSGNSFILISEPNSTSLRISIRVESKRTTFMAPSVPKEKIKK